MEIYNKIKNGNLSLEEFEKICKIKITKEKEIKEKKIKIKKDPLVLYNEYKEQGRYKAGGVYYNYKRKNPVITWGLYNRDEKIGEYTNNKDLVLKVKEVFDRDIKNHDIYSISSRYKNPNPVRIKKTLKDLDGLKIIKLNV